MQPVAVGRRLITRLCALVPEEMLPAGASASTELLERYLAYTFARLEAEGKVACLQGAKGRSEEELWVMNTGLVDASFEDVYCVCAAKQGPGDSKGWEAKAFCTAGRSRYGRLLMDEFGEGLPSRAQYFSSLAEPLADPTRPVDVDYEALRAQRDKVASSVLAEVGVTDDQSFEAVLRVAVDVAQARLARFPLSALPAWGGPVGIEGPFFCLPLCLAEQSRVDVVLALEEAGGDEASMHGKSACYRASTLLGLADACLAAWLVRPPDAGTGWAKSAFEEADAAHVIEQGDDTDDRSGEVRPDDAKSDEAVPADAHEPDSSVGSTASHVPLRVVARARLRCTDERIPAYLLRPGDTVGILRRKDVEPPSVVLPSRHGFEGVSQVQGRFETTNDGGWEFVHEGSNWTLVRHRDGRESLLRERGARVRMEMGDQAIFSGSPPFVLGR